MATAHDAITPSLDPSQLDTLVVQESVEKSNGIAASPHASDKMIRKALLALKNLTAGFISNHPVKITNNHRIGMRTEGAAENVVGRTHICYPIAHGFIDRLFECSLPCRHPDHLRSEEPHTRYVEGLALHVHGAHVNHTLHPEPCSGGCRGDTMLACSGFRNDTGFPHSAGEEDLADGVVDFMRSGVQKVFALEIDFSPTEFGSQALSQVERSWTPTEISE